MSKPSDQFSQVELALDAQLAAVQQRADGRWLAIVPYPVVVHLVLLQLKVQMQSLFRGMVEYDSPLIHFGTVVVQFVARHGKWPHIVAVTPDVVGQERNGVHAFLRKVVQKRR